MTQLQGDLAATSSRAGMTPGEPRFLWDRQSLAQIGAKEA